MATSWLPAIYLFNMQEELQVAQGLAVQQSVSPMHSRLNMGKSPAAVGFEYHWHGLESCCKQFICLYIVILGSLHMVLTVRSVMTGTQLIGCYRCARAWQSILNNYSSIINFAYRKTWYFAWTPQMIPVLLNELASFTWARSTFDRCYKIVHSHAYTYQQRVIYC